MISSLPGRLILRGQLLEHGHLPFFPVRLARVGDMGWLNHHI